MNINELTNHFLLIFGPADEEIRCYFAPGRVNLIGEHTDYNNGFVLPCALSFGTYLAVRKIPRPVIRFASSNFDFSAEVPVSKQYLKQGGEWINYPLGVMQMFNQEGLETGGLELYFSGNIPPAAGLSSSASIEMVTAFALNDLSGWKQSVMDLVHLSRKAENEFVGVSCGIMDQFAVGQGKAGHAIFLNCGTLAFHHVPANLPGYRLVITNTNKKRGLADSKYNERVAECRKAVEYLSKGTDIKSLGDISLDQFTQLQELIPDRTVLARARHVVSEDQRVLESVKSLMNGDLETFGKLMVRSHESLRKDYEVTGFELDALVDTMLEQEGVLGARMTGAGFGGCTVAFVREETLDTFIENVARDYLAKTSLTADFYLPAIGNGVSRL
jgi:galactokinase